MGLVSSGGVRRTYGWRQGGHPFRVEDWVKAEDSGRWSRTGSRWQRRGSGGVNWTGTKPRSAYVQGRSLGTVGRGGGLSQSRRK